jgi:hypothetical protein
MIENELVVMIFLVDMVWFELFLWRMSFAWHGESGAGFVVDLFGWVWFFGWWLSL